MTPCRCRAERLALVGLATPTAGWLLEPIAPWWLEPFVWPIAALCALAAVATLVWGTERRELRRIRKRWTREYRRDGSVVLPPERAP